MEKEAVEVNDLRFRQKVDELRKQLESRRQLYVRKRKAGFRLMCILLGSLVIVTAAGYYLRGQTALRAPIVFPGVSTKPMKVSAPSQELSSTQPCTPQSPVPVRATAAVVRPAAPLMPSAPTVVEEPRLVQPPAPAAEVVHVSPAVEPSDALAAPPPGASAVSSTTPAPRITDSVPRTTPLANPDASVMARAGPAPPIPAPPVAAFRITASQACLDVVARECVGAQAVFALHEHHVPHVWMTVHSQNLPYRLKHVYYHEGERYAEVPLAITYPRMRTWSNVTLRSLIHVGAWRVDIVAEDGTVVKQVEFRVTP